MARQKISIALCTYNGSRYLEEQLDSIAAQTRRPDEMVICDDCSTDSTLDIIEIFAGRAAFPVRLRINDKNLGSARNFEKAMGLCTGDIIALSDQDDVWRPDKLEQIEAKFSVSPGAGLVFSDAEVVDEHLCPMGYRLWQAKGFKSAEQVKVAQGRAAEVLLKHNVVTGATAAFRAKYRELLKPFPPGWQHDAWIALVIASCADLAMINEPLIKYRQHDGQQLGARKKWFLARVALSLRTDQQVYSHQVIRYEAVHGRLLVNPELLRGDVVLQVEGKIAHLKTRGSMPRAKLRRLALILRELMTRRYYLYSYGWKSAARDFFFS